MCLNALFQTGDIVGQELDLYPHNVGVVVASKVLVGSKNFRGIRGNRQYLVRWHLQVCEPSIWYDHEELSFVMDRGYVDFLERIHERIAIM